MGFCQRYSLMLPLGLAAGAIASMAIGCRSLETPADLTAALGSQEPARTATLVDPVRRPVPLPEPTPPHEFQEDGWTLTAVAADQPDAPAFRWQHAGLAKLLALPPEDRPDVAALLTADDPVAATNAAILLARAGDESVDRCLIESVRNEKLNLPQRLAAVEAIAAEDAAIAGPALAELLDEFSDAGDSRYSAELHAELMRGLAKHVDASASHYFADGLVSKHAEVRQVALYAYTVSRTGVLPGQALELRKDANPRVRAAALACLAARRHPQALEFAEAALSDFHLDVRLAAVQALGELGNAQARTDLQRLLIHEPETIRAGAILALAATGDDITVFASANDASWQVRRSVAQSLGRFVTPRGATIARQLLADRSAEVRRAVIDALGSWPLSQGGPILISAMADAPQVTRKQAAEKLAQLWPPAREFTSDAPPERRAEQLSAIQDHWRHAQIGGEPWAVALPASAAPSEEPKVDENPTSTSLAAHHRLLNTSDPMVDLVDQLLVEDVHARRAAAHRLAEMAGERQPFDEMTLGQLADVAMAETDPLVWRDLLRSVKDSASPSAARMASVGVSHASADVRRLSCGYLAAHSHPEHAVVLYRLLGDPNRAVVLAAIDALSVPDMAADPAPLERLLGSDDGALRVASARALAVNGHATGAPALVRLAGDADVETRRLAVTAMGQLRDVSYVDALILRLDDELSVRLASVASLAQIVGRDVTVAEGSTPASLADQVVGWKKWWAEQPQQTAQAQRSAEAPQRR
ncbi:MAG TPA: HEAT repeat domain-containing protein [Pirellulales bacterium]|nr:HEAT repeat domain-containing protein [Pirellulales bacterium]